jgi:hypothetical protein
MTNSHMPRTHRTNLLRSHRPMRPKAAGKKPAELQLDFEQFDAWPLNWIEAEGVSLSYHVDKCGSPKTRPTQRQRLAHTRQNPA